MALSIDELTALRADWFAAWRAVSTGQSYTIAGRVLTRVDARECRLEFRRIDAELDALTSGRGVGIRMRRVIPRDL